MLKDLMVSGPHSGSPAEACAACGSVIKDRYYLLAVDRAWHVQCLRCCRCSQPLDSELSCFQKEGNIYCKEDYLRLFSVARCARCMCGISSAELVMRARELVFHVHCFVCCVCHRTLNKGDTAAVRAGLVYCAPHYDAITANEAVYFSSTGQKGRPRKRKPQSLTQQQQQLAAVSSDQVQELTAATLRMAELMHSAGPTDLGSPLDLGSYDGSQSPGGSISGMSSAGGCGGSGGGSNRTKRMRTSFKHHQLRTMKSYFAINQNPDAKDLKQLAQKTGLSKRVLQVWFQNARAKWRRNVMRSESGTGGSLGPGGLLPGTTTGSSGTSLNGGGGVSGGHQTGLHMAGDNSDSSMASVNHGGSLEDMHHQVMGTFSDLY